MSKFEKLLDLLVNEQKDEAEKVFHEIVVEKSRQIYEGILAEEEETSEADESSNKDEGDEVDEAKDESKDSEDKVEETADEEVEETEEPAESTDETIEEIGGDATDDLLSDIEAEAHGMDDMEMPGEEGEEGEAEEMFEPLEKELDALKAEFAKMMDDKDSESEEEPEEESVDFDAQPTEEATEEELEVEESTSKDADTLIKEYSEMVSSGHGAEKMGSEKNADHKASPVAKSNKPVNSAGAHKMDQGGEGKGGVGKALTGDTAKDMGVAAKNEPGIKSAKLDNAPKAQEKEGSADSKSPVASK